MESIKPDAEANFVASSLQKLKAMPGQFAAPIISQKLISGYATPSLNKGISSNIIIHSSNQQNI